MTPSLAPRRRSLYTLLLCGVFALSTVTALPRSAAAASCSTIPSCIAGAKITVANSIVSFGAALTLFTTTYYSNVAIMMDSLTRVGNSDTVATQSGNHADAATADMETAIKTSTSQAAANLDTIKNIEPTVSGCNIMTRAQTLNKATYSSTRAAAYAGVEKARVAAASNAAGTPSEKGAVSDALYTFNDTMKGFCDATVLKPPQGINCTVENDSKGRSMAFAYAQPYRTILRKEDFTIPKDPNNVENRAARLFAKLVTEPVAPDPIKGAALTRDEGKQLFLQRQADIAAMQLARGAIDRMTDERIGVLNVVGQESVAALRQKAWADAAAAYRDALKRSEQMIGSNDKDIPLLLADINRIYMQIYKNMEQIAAIKAAHLARNVQEGGIRSVSATGRPTSAN